MIFSDEREFKSAEEFVDFFLKDQFFRTKHVYQANTTGRGNHIFRGQADSKWELKPGVFRSHDTLNKFTPQPPGKFDINSKFAWLGLHLHAELRSVRIFLETADRLGVETPIDYSWLKDHTDLIDNLLNNEKYDFSEVFPRVRALEELALAQHHQVPTRLLDWSESPLVACFFAARPVSAVADSSNKVDSEKIAVICLDTLCFSRSEEIVSVRAPNHRNNFLRCQQGLFTHLQNANSYFLDHNEWPSIENVVEETKELNGALKKYSLPSTEANDLVRILFDHNVTTHQLMPTLDNIAKSYEYASILFGKSKQ